MFSRLWAATAVSNLGDGVRQIALPLLATEVTRDPRLIAGVAVADRLPFLLFLLPGGAWADRYDRLRIRVRLDYLRAMIVLVLAIAAHAHLMSIYLVFVVAALLASAEAVVDSSSMALVPSIVPAADLERAAGRLSSTELVAGAVIGPLLGGVLFSAGTGFPFWVDSVSFVLAAMIAGTIVGNFAPDGAAVLTQSTQSMRERIGEGFRWLWSNRLFRNLALMSTALGAFSFIGVSLQVLLARDVLGLDPYGVGLLLLPAAIGGVLGSVVATKFVRWPLNRVLSASVLATGACTVGIGKSSSAIVVGLLLAGQSFTVMIWNVMTMALRQREIPGELLGRAGASYRFLVFFGMPIGALCGGFLGSALDVQTAFVIDGLGLIAMSVPVVLFARSPHGAESTC